MTPRRAANTLRSLALAIALAAGTTVHAEDLGVIGPVHAIAEPHLLDLIASRLKQLRDSGGLDQLQRAHAARIRGQIESPPAVPGLTRTVTPRSFHHDPSVMIPNAIRDQQGQVLVAAGTRVNPLEVVTLSRPLLFFDARDEAQVERARREVAERPGGLRLILTGGSYLALMRRWQQPVYYDQQGLLVARLGIRQVPALVTQEGTRLRIDEIR